MVHVCVTEKRWEGGGQRNGKKRVQSVGRTWGARITRRGGWGTQEDESKKRGSRQGEKDA